MAKKTGAVKKKKNAKARRTKAAPDTPQGKNQEASQAETPAQQGGLRSLLRLVKKDEEQSSQGRRPPRVREKRDKPKKGFFHGIAKFFQSVLGELKKVHWPTRSETAVYTMVVIGSVIFVSLLIWIADSILSRLVALLLRL